MKYTALITGATSGIGLELAKLCSQEGMQLVLIGRNTELLKNINEFKNAHIITKDLAVKNAVQEITEELDSKGIEINILINAAGFGDYGLFDQSNWAKQEQMIQVNITALTQLCHAYIPKMRNAKNGYILNIASTAAFFPGPLMSVYYATKAYVVSFSQALHNELQGEGVSVTTLCPGPTESNFQNAANLSESKIVKGKQLPSSKEVALFGFNAMMQRKDVVVHGVMNKAIVEGVRILPRSILASVVRYAQERKK